MQLTLSGWMSLEVWQVLLVFARVSSAFMLLPGYGEPNIPVRVRFLAALGIAVAAAPVIQGMPLRVPGAWGILIGVGAEATAGALLGVLARTLISGVLAGGQIIGQNVGLANVFALGLGYDQSATIGATLYAGTIAALFAMGGHHAMIRMIVDSYKVFPPGAWLEIAPASRGVVLAGVRSFHLAAQLAFPFLLLGLVFNASLAAINRAMPALSVFMIGAPALVLLGLGLLAAATAGVFDQTLMSFADILALVR